MSIDTLPISDTPFTTFSFAATGAPTLRTMPDRLADVVNIREYGADPTGNTDSTSAIQSAFNVAYGPPNAPHGTANSKLNRRVWAPCGNYLISGSGLLLRSVIGAHIFGDGAFATSFFTNIPIPAILRTNGATDLTIKGIQFVGGSNSNMHPEIDGAYLAQFTPARVPGSCCISIDWDNTGPVQATRVRIQDCGTQNTYLGIGIGMSGFQCDTTIIDNCTLSAHTYGIRTFNWNALQCVLVGGGINDTTIGAFAEQGSITPIIGTTFSTIGSHMPNDHDLMFASGDSVVVVGSRSESANFCNILAGTITFQGVHHLPGVSGEFCNIAYGATAIVDGCVSPLGKINGHITGELYKRGSKFSDPTYKDAFIAAGGVVVQDI